MQAEKLWASQSSRFTTSASCQLRLSVVLHTAQYFGKVRTNQWETNADKRCYWWCHFEQIQRGFHPSSCLSLVQVESLHFGQLRGMFKQGVFNFRLMHKTELNFKELVDSWYVIPTDQSSHKNATKSIKANPSVISPTHARTERCKTTEDVIHTALCCKKLPSIMPSQAQQIRIHFVLWGRTFYFPPD